jgi:hypothetical protein
MGNVLSYLMGKQRGLKCRQYSKKSINLRAVVVYAGMTYSTVWHLKQMVTSEESGKPFLNFLM